MSEYVQLESEGLFVYKWSGKKRDYVRRRPKKNTVLTHLRSHCKIKEGTTLLDIFRAVAKYKLLKLVISQYSWCGCIDKFHAQAEEPMRSEDKGSKLDYLEIYWDPQVHEYSETIKHPDGHKDRIHTASFDAYTGFQAIGDQEPDDPYQSKDGKEHYSVSHTPMYDLADLPVKLNEAFVVYSPWKAGQKQELLVKAERTYSLLEVLDAIYADISFMGGPADNAAFIEKMMDTAEKIESGEEQTIPWENVKEQLGIEEDEDREPGLILNIHLDDQPTKKMELVSCARLEENEYILLLDGKENIRVKIEKIEQATAEPMYWCKKEQLYQIRLSPEVADFLGVEPPEEEQTEQPSPD